MEDTAEAVEALATKRTCSPGSYSIPVATNLNLAHPLRNIWYIARTLTLTATSHRSASPSHLLSVVVTSLLTLAFDHIRDKGPLYLFIAH